MTGGGDASGAGAGRDEGADTDRLTGAPVGVRLRQLVAALTAMADDTPLPESLARVVEAAVRTVDARSGALVARGPDGGPVKSTYPGAVDAAERLPADLGLLGTLAAHRGVVRLRRTDDGPAPAGDPVGRPRPGTFLGVAVRVRGQVLGALCLTDRTGGADFTVEDGLLMEALAAAAGVAVDNARLAEDRRRQARWAEAFTEIRAALVAAVDRDEALPLLAARARELLGGAAALLLLPDPGAPRERLVVLVADGKDTARLRGLRTPVADSPAGQVYRDGQARSIADVAAQETGEPAFAGHGGYGPAVLAPLGGAMGFGVLIVARPAGTPALSGEVTAAAADFGAQAAMALRMDRAQRDQRALALLADRERIGRDLHDHVIQQLFATGMGLESMTRQLTEPALQDRLRRSVDDLDRTVHDIRRAIFELQEPEEGTRTLRRRIVDVLDAATDSAPLVVEVVVADSVDAVVPPEVADEALAVLHQAVTTVIRHAAATRLSIAVTAAGRLRIEITDDGSGCSADGRRDGLAERAERLGGVLDLDAGPTGRGARLVWDVPLP